jgi:hypothetical protein
MTDQHGDPIEPCFQRAFQRLRHGLLATLMVVGCAVGSQVHAEQSFQAVCDDAAHFPEYHRLDFLLGRWVIFAGGAKFADATLVRPSGGCALVETWRALPAETFANRPSLSNALIAYDSETKRWQYFWVSGVIGLVLHFTAVPDNDLIWSRSEISPEGIVKQQRVKFSRVSDRELHEQGVSSVDNGATWVTEYDLVWRRK